ncbi:GSCOCT00013993001.2-RA-CDS [Cotesia congregata]|uniref:Odorant receptor n=1 Tax=Cotesia congregata TaxID=51543 RepID=A0A8J2HHL3_COTCN|nr:GSCOCT00013993001.2-RA-CDS [Cotesia congregata]CAG5098042.1 olfactory receptor 64 [Cotesia congregata]
MKPAIRRLGFENGRSKVTPEAAVSFTRLTVWLTCIWAPTGRLNLILFEAFLWFSIFLSLGLFVPLIVCVIKLIDDTFVVMKSFILISGIVNFVLKVIVCRIYRDELQELGGSLNDFIKNASQNDRLYLQKYVNKCWMFHGYMTCSYYLTTTAVLMGPLVLPEKFPSDAVYPFSVDHPVVATIVYAHQCIVGYQCSAGMALDCQAALFLWYLSARFEILISEIDSLRSLDKMRDIIKTHQEILRFAKQVVRPIRLIVLTTVTMTKVGMIFGAIVLISDESITVKVQFAILVISATINIYVCTWAADNLLTVSSESVSEKIFSTTAMHSPVIRKLWLSVIHRTQKPITINIPGFLETLSNEFYSNFLSTAFSYFAAMHALV